MKKSDIRSLVINVVEKHAKRAGKQASVTESTNLVNDLNVNPQSLLSLVLDMEDRFSIELSEDDIGGMATVADAVKIVEKRFH